MTHLGKAITMSVVVVSVVVVCAGWKGKMKMNDWQKLVKKLNGDNPQLHRTALKYAEQAMWDYILNYKEEYKKPNQVDKSRNRAVMKQCYKRAKKDLERKQRVKAVFDKLVAKNGDALKRLSKE